MLYRFLAVTVSSSLRSGAATKNGNTLMGAKSLFQCTAAKPSHPYWHPKKHHSTSAPGLQAGSGPLSQGVRTQFLETALALADQAA